MFAIGFACGAAVSFLIIIIGISVVAGRITKDRADSSKAMLDYWRESMDNQAIQIRTLENINASIRERG